MPHLPITHGSISVLQQAFHNSPYFYILQSTFWNFDSHVFKNKTGTLIVAVGKPYPFPLTVLFTFFHSFHGLFNLFDFSPF